MRIISHAESERLVLEAVHENSLGLWVISTIDTTHQTATRIYPKRFKHYVDHGLAAVYGLNLARRLLKLPLKAPEFSNGTTASTMNRLSDPRSSDGQAPQLHYIRDSGFKETGHQNQEPVEVMYPVPGFVLIHDLPPLDELQA